MKQEEKTIEELDVKVSNPTYSMFYHTKEQHGNMFMQSFGFAIPRVTIAARINSYDNVKVITFGAAKCSFKDNFSKAKGRQLAENRAISKPLCSMTFSNKTCTAKTIVDIMRMIAQQVQLGTVIGDAFLKGECE